MMTIPYDHDVANTPLDPATHIPLLKVVYNDKILEERFQSAGGLNFFNPEVDQNWKNDLSMHHSIRLRFKNYQNPFNIVAVSQVAYREDEDCPPVLDDLCDPTVVSTENSWRSTEVRFRNKFRVGVTWCVETERLLYQDAESRFDESIDASETVVSTIGWSELITQAIATPANKLLPTFTLSSTHYYDAGSTDRLEVLTKVFQYMQRVYGQRWQSEFVVVADPQLELDLLDVNQSSLHQYDKTGIPTAQANVDTLTAGGFRPMAAIPKLWNKAILLAPDVVDYYPTTGDLAGQNLNPFRNADGSKYYVVVVSKRAFFHGTTPLMDKQYFPAVLGNKYAGIQQTWLDFYKLLFPNEIFVVAFDQEDFQS